MTHYWQRKDVRICHRLNSVVSSINKQLDIPTCQARNTLLLKASALELNLHIAKYIILPFELLTSREESGVGAPGPGSPSSYSF